MQLITLKRLTLLRKSNMKFSECILLRMIIELGKSYYSVEDIKVALDSKGISIAEKTLRKD